MKQTTLKKCLSRFLIILIILWGLPHTSFALAPRTQITTLLNNLDTLSSYEFRKLLFDKQLTFNQLLNVLNKKFNYVSPEILTKKLNHEIGKEKIIPILNNSLQISFKASNHARDLENIFWLFIPNKNTDQKIKTEGFPYNPGIKGTVVGATKETCRKNPFLKNYVISNEKGVFSYAYTCTLLATTPKIFFYRKNPMKDISQFEDIANLLINIQDDNRGDKELIDRINSVLQMAYNLAKEDANITTIMAALFYDKKIVEAMAVYLDTSEKKVLGHFVSAYDKKIIKEKIKKAKKLGNYPFLPHPDDNNSFLYYLGNLIQQSNLDSKEDPIFGKGELDILMLAIFSKIEEIDHEPENDFQRDAQLFCLNIYGPLLEMVNKNHIADQLRDIYFKYNQPEIYRALTNALRKVFGMSYSELQNHLEYTVLSRLQKCLTPLKEKYPFTFRYRVKSLYSLWEKIESKHAFDPKKSITSNIETVLRDGILLKDGKPNRLDDLYGLQVVFDISHTRRRESRMNAIQKKILDTIDQEFQTDQEPVTFLRKKKYISEKGFHEEKIIPIWKDENGIEYRGEIQVLSDKDLDLYKYGATDEEIIAHWGFKLKNMKYGFDKEILNVLKKLQYQYTNDPHKNFRILFDYFKRYMFTSVYKSPYLTYLKLPAGSNRTDAASASNINQLSLSNYVSILMPDMSNGKLAIKKEKVVSPGSTIKPGDILCYHPAKLGTGSFGGVRHKIIRTSKRMETIVQLTHGPFETNKLKNIRRKLNHHIRSILNQIPLNNDIDTLISNSINNSLSLLQINNTDELYKLAYILATEKDQRTILKLSNLFFQDALGIPLQITDLDFVYLFLNIPKKDQSPLFVLAKYLTAEQIGKEKLQHQYNTLIKDKKDFDDISNTVLKYALKQTAQRHNFISLRQLYAFIGFKKVSPYQVLFDQYNRNFFYTINMNAKGKYINPHKLFLALEKAGLDSLPTIRINKNRLLITVISPSLIPNPLEKSIIESKVRTILPTFGITDYEISTPSKRISREVHITITNRHYKRQIIHALQNLGLKLEKTKNGLITKIPKQIPIRIIEKLLKDTLDVYSQKQIPFSIIEINQTTSLTRQKQFLQAA